MRKRGEQIQDGACSAPGDCTPVVADQLLLADGQNYNSVDMDAGLLEEWTGLMVNGSTTADIPGVFKAFEISA